MRRSIAQPGSASGLGPESRGFESHCSDHFFVHWCQRTTADAFLFSVNPFGRQTCAKSKGLPLLSQREPFRPPGNHPADTPVEILRLLMSRDFRLFKYNGTRIAPIRKTPSNAENSARTPRNGIFTSFIAFSPKKSLMIFLKLTGRDRAEFSALYAKEIGARFMLSIKNITKTVSPAFAFCQTGIAIFCKKCHFLPFPLF